MKITGDILRAVAQPRWAALPEAFALTALAWFVNRAFFWNDPGFTQSLFNAYLVAVLLISGRYGVPPGLFTAGLCVLAGSASHVVARGAPGPATYLSAGAGGVASVTLALAAVAVGGIASGHRARLKELVERHDRARERIANLERTYRLALEEKDLEEKRVLSDEGTFIALVTMFDDLDRLDPAAVPERLLKVARRVLGGGVAALYRASGGTFALAAGDRERWPVALDMAREPVLAAAVVTHARASVNGLPLAPGDPVPEKVLVAVPIRADADRWMLVIGDLHFVGFAEDRLAALDGCAQIAGRALERARLFAATQDRNVVDPATGACAYAFFQKRLAEELALARRHKKPLGLLALRDRYYESLTEPAAKDARRIELAGALKAALRDGDLLAHHTAGESFVMLLPFTPSQGVQVVQDRLTRSLGHETAVHRVDVDPASSKAPVLVQQIDALMA